MAYTVHTNGIRTGTTRGRPPPAHGRAAYGTGSKPMLAHVALSCWNILVLLHAYVRAIGTFRYFLPRNLDETLWKLNLNCLITRFLYVDVSYKFIQNITYISQVYM